MKHSLIFALCLLIAIPAVAAPKLTVKGKITNGAGYRVLLIGKSGETKAKTLTGPKFAFKKLAKSFVKNARLVLARADGSVFGPVVLGYNKNNRSYLTLSGKADEDNIVDLGKIDLLTDDSFARAKKVKAKYFQKTNATLADSTGKPEGAGRSGLVTVSASSALTVSADERTEPGADFDLDGISNDLDVDDDGDSLLDVADADTSGTTASDSPFTTLYLGLLQTLNANVLAVTQEQIDAVIGGENVFALIFFLSFGPDSTIDGGHVICSNSLVYCRATAAGGGTAIYSGVSESDAGVLNQVWSNYNANGSGFPNLEPITRGQDKTLVAGIQPRVGTTQFRPGDLYQLQFTVDGRANSSRTMSLPPYFVTVPALKSYNPGTGVVNVDYGDSNQDGSSSGDPIVLNGAGELTVTIYRPQRQIISGAEEGDYRDQGHLHYGLIIGGGSQEFTCAGKYSNLSATLTEDADGLGTGGSPLSQNGAKLAPLTDSADDAAPDQDNSMSFTTDLAECLSRGGEAPGTYMVTLTATGESFSGGANRAGQNFWVTIP